MAEYIRGQLSELPRKRHSAANFSILRRTAFSLLKNETTHKVGTKNKRLTAAWNEHDLAKVLFGT